MKSTHRNVRRALNLDEHGGQVVGRDRPGYTLGPEHSGDLVLS